METELFWQIIATRGWSLPVMVGIAIIVIVFIAIVIARSLKSAPAEDENGDAP